MCVYAFVLVCRWVFALFVEFVVCVYVFECTYTYWIS